MLSDDLAKADPDHGLDRDGAARGLARVGRALADPTRCRIVLALLERPAGPGELALQLGLTGPNVSNHLALLRDANLVQAEPHGRRTTYRVTDTALRFAIEELVEAALDLAAGEPELGG